MKKHKVELLIILVMSSCVALLLPNYLKGSDTILIPSLSTFSTYFLAVFLLLAVLFFTNKQKEKIAQIPNGHQKLYNEQGQITKEGLFNGGKLINGSQYIYKKDGTLSHTETFINGIKTKNA